MSPPHRKSFCMKMHIPEVVWIPVSFPAKKKGRSETESKAELPKVTTVCAHFQSESTLRVGGVAINK
jgi:hypothetical protein